MSLTADKTKRINILDSFRCIAIIMVILMHYGYSYVDYYPYKSSLTSYFIISHGYLGVQLFFMISGFVILMTLEKSKSWFEFIIKRITRLWPTILFCSLATYTFFSLFDTAHKFPLFHNSIIDFAPSLTFTDLWIWNRVFHKQVQFIDGVYWTLAYEMKFYLLSSIIYYINRRHFFRNWLLFVSTILIIYIALVNIYPSLITLHKLIKLCLFPEYIVLFTLGMFFYLLFTNKAVRSYYKYALIILTIAEFYIINNWIESAYIIGFVALFIVFLYKPNWLTVLNNPLFIHIGLISYPLYLIHSHIGVFLISWFSELSHIQSPGLLMLIVTTFLAGIAYFIHKYFENPSNKFLRNYLFKRFSETKTIEVINT